MTLVLNDNEYTQTTIPTATFTNVSTTEASYASTAATELSFMPVTFDTTNTENERTLIFILITREVVHSSAGVHYFCLHYCQNQM